MGLGIAGRTHPDIENIIGFFVNTLPIRTRLKQDITFNELLEQVKENALEAYENQDYPFDELVSKLNLTSNLNRNPLFDMAFVVQNMETEDIEIENLRMIPYDFQTGVSRFDIMMLARENENSLVIMLEYSTALFKRTTAEKFAERYCHILNQVLENGEIKLKDIVITHDFAVAKSSIIQKDTDDFGF